MSDDRVGVGVIGCGYWGPNLIRNFYQMSQTRVRRIADLDEERLAHMSEMYHGVETSKNYLDVISDNEIDLVAIATPVRTHFKFASEALKAGKHVFVEKPLCASVEEAETLIALAEENNRKLMVGHTFEYTPSVRKIKEYIDSGELGEIYYINAQRLNLGLFQQDINVLWDLAPHDISIILYLLESQPNTVFATGTSHINPHIEDVGMMSLEFSDNLIVFLQNSWLDPDKVRKITIVGSKKMVVYDDVEPTEKIRVYDKGVETPERYDNFGDFPYAYKYGDVVIPKLSGGEPLRTELQHLVDCILNDESPLSDGLSGLRVIRILEAAQRSLASGLKEPLIG